MADVAETRGNCTKRDGPRLSPGPRNLFADRDDSDRYVVPVFVDQLDVLAATAGDEGHAGGAGTE